MQFAMIFEMSFIEILALQSVIYFVYRGFGLNQYSYLQIITLQFLLYIVASSTPLPGDSGAQEGGFYYYFAKFFPQSTIFAALILWRFITFYLQIFMGFIAVIIDQAIGKREQKQESGIGIHTDDDDEDFDKDDKAKNEQQENDLPRDESEILPAEDTDKSS